MDRDFLKQISYLGKYLRPHRRILVFSFSLSGISTALGMIQPYFAKILIDKVFLAREIRLLWPLLAALICLLITGFIIRVTNSYLYTRYSGKLLFKMREDLFDHLQKIPLKFFYKKKSGDLFSRIASDMVDIQVLLTETIPHYFFDFITCIITVVILLWLNWQMALMSFVFLPLALYGVHLLQPKLIGLSRRTAETNADIAHFIFEALSGTSLIRAMGAEKMEGEKLKKKHDGLLGILLKYQILRAYSGSVPTGFIIINTLIVFGYGGYLVFDNVLSIGGLVAFSIYQGRVFAPLQGLLDGFLALQKSRVALTRVKELLDIDPAAEQSGDLILSEKELKGDIAFEDVTFFYEQEDPVLKNQTFRIPGGKITALVGPSGVGKTTICHLLLRLYDPDAGRITLDGKDLRSLRLDWLRKQVGLVSQDTFLFHTSIMENIKYARPEAGTGEIINASKAACIHEFIETLPQGYDTVVGDRGIRLSGGQKQRLSIARAILLDPKILILDEATAFLDSSVEDQLKEALASLMENRTILVVSHRYSTLQGAEKVIAFQEDGLVYEGGAEQFFINGKDSSPDTGADE